MAKENCADCGKPREPEATTYSYCIECGKQRQRDSYAKRMADAGKLVTPRIKSDSTISHLHKLKYRPGPCQICDEHSPLLVPLYLEPESTDPDVEDMNKLLPRLFIVTCKPCSDLTAYMTPELWYRFAKIAVVLAKRRVTRAEIVWL